MVLAFQDSFTSGRRDKRWERTFEFVHSEPDDITVKDNALLFTITKMSYSGYLTKDYVEYIAGPAPRMDLKLDRDIAFMALDSSSEIRNISVDQSQLEISDKGHVISKAVLNPGNNRLDIGVDVTSNGFRSIRVEMKRMLPKQRSQVISIWNGHPRLGNLLKICF